MNKRGAFSNTLIWASISNWAYFKLSPLLCLICMILFSSSFSWKWMVSNGYWTEIGLICVEIRTSQTLTQIGRFRPDIERISIRCSSKLSSPKMGFYIASNIFYTVKTLTESLKPPSIFLLIKETPK